MSCCRGYAESGSLELKRLVEQQTGTWGSRRAWSKSPPITDAFAAWDYTREWKKDEKRKKEEGEEEEGWHWHDRTCCRQTC